MITISISYTDGRHRDLKIQGNEPRRLRVPADVAAEWDAGAIERLSIVRLAGPRATRLFDVKLEAKAGRHVTRPVESGFSPLGEVLR